MNLTLENKSFEMFSDSLNLLKEQKISEEQHQKVIDELRDSITITHQMAFSFMMSEKKDEKIFAFLENIYQIKDNLIAFSKLVLKQEKIIPSMKRIEWFLNQILKTNIFTQQELFELHLVNPIQINQKKYLEIVSTRKPNNFFVEGYCQNIFVYLTHCLNQSLVIAHNKEFKDVIVNMLICYQQVTEKDKQEIEKEVLPTLLGFSNNLTVSYIWLNIFNVSPEEKCYHPYLVLPLFSQLTELKHCYQIFDFYQKNKIDAFNESPHSEKLLFSAFIYVIKHHFITQNSELLIQDLENFSQLGYDLKLISEQSTLLGKLDEIIKFYYDKQTENMKDKKKVPLTFIEYEQYYLNFKNLLHSFHQDETHRRIKI